MKIPTQEGRKRYRPDGIYKGPFTNDQTFWEVCTCVPECPDPCLGQCGCQACVTAYEDTLYFEGVTSTKF
ncbi:MULTISPECIES: hypothetical protein [unclassified Methylocaldum]|jgi:hypothetical protein|uniref:hypothetical protein n=1 Tax=unclassified Methylocaldum TaxID=2622260 RepID=UPI00098B7CF3|nr:MULTISPECIES: hypothetical protein [unclassified Methylocaldum]MBP1153007.1 hypothetical protein [Methylocaldum sp. RMAD-M]MVF21230.1 hypothetical protein [Methylocaldum sp. BRCS4]